MMPLCRHSARLPCSKTYQLSWQASDFVRNNNVVGSFLTTSVGLSRSWPRCLQLSLCCEDTFTWSRKGRFSKKETNTHPCTSHTFADWKCNWSWGFCLGLCLPQYKLNIKHDGFHSSDTDSHSNWLLKYNFFCGSLTFLQHFQSLYYARLYTDIKEIVAAVIEMLIQTFLFFQILVPLILSGIRD